MSDEKAVVLSEASAEGQQVREIELGRIDAAQEEERPSAAAAEHGTGAEETRASLAVAPTDAKKSVETAAPSNPPVPISKLFSALNWRDKLYIVVGTISALVTGASIPSFNILFGRMLDKINGDQSKFDETINLTAIILAAVGGLALLVGALQIYCWTAVGERLTQRMREMYVTAILRQEIGWFDKIGATELAPKVADLCGKVLRRIYFQFCMLSFM